MMEVVRGASRQKYCKLGGTLTLVFVWRLRRRRRSVGDLRGLALLSLVIGRHSHHHSLENGLAPVTLFLKMA